MTEPSPNVPPMTTPTSESARAPRVFISYAHDSDAHREHVRDLWIFLCAHGVDARIDRVAAEQRQDWTLWMEQQVAEADRVLVVASPAYKQRAGHKADPDEGRGVQYEARLIRNLFYRNQSDLSRFLPIVLPGGSIDDVPDFLTPAITTVYRLSEFTVAGAESLLRISMGARGRCSRRSGRSRTSDPRPHSHSRPVTAAAGAAAARAHRRRRRCCGTRSMSHSRSTTTELHHHRVLAGARLGRPASGSVAGRARPCWDNLDLTDVATDRLARLGTGLWTALFDEPVTRRLLELIDTSPLGTSVDLVVHLPEPLSWLPVELLRVPGDQRLLATIAGVSRSPAGCPGSTAHRSAPSPGPLKILAAIAAPDETDTEHARVDVEAEMQALLDAVTDPPPATARSGSWRSPP